MIGYEYTTFGGYNLHRNVVFRGDASVANQTVPFSQYDSQNPEDLWQHLDEFQKRTGAQVLAIPHNGNLSNGRMFSVNRFDGKTPYDRVLEIPTPRWTAYEAKRFDIKMSDNVPMTTQERAYTSPIWYIPASET